MSSIEEDNSPLNSIEIDENSSRIINQKKFPIKQNNIIYYITIKLLSSSIKIECSNKKNTKCYEYIADLKSLQNLSNCFIFCDSIKGAYEVLLNIFNISKGQKNKTSIQEKKKENQITINLLTFLNFLNKEEKIIINLKCKKDANNELSVKYNILENDVNNLKTQINDNNNQLVNITHINKLNKKLIDKNFDQFINKLDEINKKNKDLLKKYNRLEKKYNELEKLATNVFNKDKENKNIFDNFINNNHKNREIEINTDINQENDSTNNNINNNVICEELDRDNLDNQNINNIINDIISYNDQNNGNNINNNLLSDNNKKNKPKMKFDHYLTENSCSKFSGNNNFILYKSKEGIPFLVYATDENSIVFLNLNSENIFHQIQNAHKNTITNFQYTFDENNNRDLLLSISDINLKIWDLEKYDLINEINVNFKRKRKIYIFSACFLIDVIRSKNYILVTNSNHEPIKLYDLENINDEKEISNSENENVYLINSFYDNIKTKKYYIVICGQENMMKSFDFEETKLFKKYLDNDDKVYSYMCFVIKKNKSSVNLIGSDSIGYIKIWNFHTGKLLNKIQICNNESLRGICLYNKYLFVCADDKTIKLINIEKNEVVQVLDNQNEYASSIGVININEFGDVLISQEIDIHVKNNQNKKLKISLWVNTNRYN